MEEFRPLLLAQYEALEDEIRGLERQLRVHQQLIEILEAQLKTKRSLQGRYKPLLFHINGPPGFLARRPPSDGPLWLPAAPKYWRPFPGDTTIPGLARSSPAGTCCQCHQARVRCFALPCGHGQCQACWCAQIDSMSNLYPSQEPARVCCAACSRTYPYSEDLQRFLVSTATASRPYYDSLLMPIIAKREEDAEWISTDEETKRTHQALVSDPIRELMHKHRHKVAKHRARVRRGFQAFTVESKRVKRTAERAKVTKHSAACVANAKISGEASIGCAATDAGDQTACPASKQRPARPHRRRKRPQRRKGNAKGMRRKGQLWRPCHSKEATKIVDN